MMTDSLNWSQFAFFSVDFNRAALYGVADFFQDHCEHFALRCVLEQILPLFLVHDLELGRKIERLANVRALCGQSALDGRAE
jgi:hypothetical protein